eukprot:scaffold156258_cov33-Tisochrysis_lutea.AAC.1
MRAAFLEAAIASYNNASICTFVRRWKMGVVVVEYEQRTRCTLYALAFRRHKSLLEPVYDVYRVRLSVESVK